MTLRFRPLSPPPVLGILLLLATVPMLGQDSSEQKPPPEEVLFQDVTVVSASKKLQLRSEAPAAVTVITSEEIERSGARTIAEAVQFVAGMNVFGMQGTDIRGVGSGSRILLLIDGRRTNDVFSGGLTDGLERPLTIVERIEVIKGPVSSLFGTNAFAGIINIITRTGMDNPGLRAQFRAGNLQSRTVETLWGGRFRDLGLLASLSAHTDEGNNFLGSNDSTHAYAFFGKAEWKEWTVVAGYRPSRRGVPNIGGIVTPRSFVKRRDSFGQIQYTKTLQPKWLLYSQIYFQRAPIVFRDPNGDIDLRDLRVEGEARANYRLTESDNLTAGIEVRRDRSIDAASRPRMSFRSSNRSVYLENEFSALPRTRITTGVRLDDNSQFGSSVNPRLGVVTALRDGTVIKAFYGSAFRGPEFVFLFTDLQLGPFRIVHNPDLRPERVRSGEVEIIRRLGRVEASLNFYRNALRDLITVVPAGGGFSYGNRGRASADGIEGGLRGDLGSAVSFFCNISLQDAKDESTGDRLPLVPRSTVNAGLFFHPGKEVSLGILSKSVASRPTTTPAGRPVELPRYNKTDLTLRTRISPRLYATAAIYNLFDTRYDRALNVPQNGIQAEIGLQYRARP